MQQKIPHIIARDYICPPTHLFYCYGLFSDSRLSLSSYHVADVGKMIMFSERIERNCAVKNVRGDIISLTYIYMKVLSLFDGISCARVALERAGIPVEAYYASEIDKYAMQISAKNWPDILQIGSVTDIGKFSLGRRSERVDLLIGGSPCQDLSIAKKNRKGLDGDRSGLFWEYVRILKEVKPKYFILENVASMPKEAKEIITKELGVEPIMIDAALVSAQRRKRLFWTNIPNVVLPNDKGILLRDILENFNPEKERKKKGLIIDGIRKLTPIECERLQCLPDNYTEGVSNTQRYKALGNAFNVDVVAHILKFIPKR